MSNRQEKPYFCYTCKDHFPNEDSKIHKKSSRHIETQENGFTICSLCKVEFRLKEKQKHAKSEVHREKLQNVFCHICKEDVPRDKWKDHQKTSTHLMAKQEAEVRCKLCREKYKLREKEEHLETEAHKQAAAEDTYDCKICKELVIKKNYRKHKDSPQHTEAKRNTKVICKLCKEELVLKAKKEHLEGQVHKTARASKPYYCRICKICVPNEDPQVHKNKIRHLEIRQNSKFKCTVCDVEYFLDEEKEHKQTEVHRKMLKNVFCRICNENVRREKWKDHEKSGQHLDAKQSTKIKCKLCRNEYVLKEKEDHPETEAHKRAEKYLLRPSSGDNQSYIDTLATFIAIRLLLDTQQDFQLSINNEELQDFGDIVFHFPREKTEVVAIRCRRSVKGCYESEVLSAERGHLSVKAQYKMMEKLVKKEDVTFLLHTVSNLVMEQREFAYDVGNWKEKDEEVKRFWENKKIKVKTYRSKEKDVFNATDYFGNVFIFRNKDLDETLTRFRMYFNQKDEIELKSSISATIQDVLRTTQANISEDLVRYVRVKLKTTKILKRNEIVNKMTRDDFEVKLSELVLLPLWVQPRSAIGRRLDLWNNLTQKFRIVVLKNHELVGKVYSAITYSLNQMVDFDFEGSKVILQFLYLTLWKTGVAPLVLNITTEKELEVLHGVVTLLKLRSSLKFVLLADFDHPKSVDVFCDLSDLETVDSELLNAILEEKINILNLSIPLRVIHDSNKDFLKKVTSDVLLNVLTGNYNFVDAADVALSEEIIENTLAFDDHTLANVREYLETQGRVKEGLSFLVTVNEEVSQVQVPPELFVPVRASGGSGCGN